MIESLYIHFPFCRHLCNYCDFYKKIGPNSEAINDFHHFFDLSWQAHQQFMEKNAVSFKKLKTLYIGGGTPSLWGKEGAIFLEDLFKREGLLREEDAECTLEVNPGSWDDQSLLAWQQFGMNRFSLGIQSLDERFLRLLDRVHSLDEVYQTLKKFQQMKVRFSVDFMLGLPFSKQYQRNILAELEEILSFGPEHISLYILTTNKGYIHAKHLPDDDFIADEYLAVSDYLKAKGFYHYEVSNFSKEGRQSQHNLQYWKSKSVAALGPSATGFLSENQLRYKWKTQNPEFVEEKLSDASFRIEKIYMGLRSEVGLKESILGPNLSEEELRSFRDLCKSWQQRGLVEIKKQGDLAGIFATSQGFLALDHLMEELFNAVKSL